ncbi:unknown [Alistipes sp. CAG:157]|nr:unknown [Alistipes sp. CAG:157]
MPIVILCIYIFIIIFKFIFFSCIIRWIDVDYVNFPFVRICKGSQGF